MSMFRTILENELERRDMSIREAAREIGISHTTLIAARDGTRALDVGTALAIAKWVGVPLSTLYDLPVPVTNVSKRSINRNPAFSATHLLAAWFSPIRKRPGGNQACCPGGNPATKK